MRFITPITHITALLAFILALFSIVNCCRTPSTQTTNNTPLRVFICVDMEGMSGIVHLTDCNIGGMDYQYFRASATEEVNAAIRGAFKAGATQIVVRDAHESMRNIIPDKLDPRATLIRGGDGADPQIMMQGIEEGFDALLYVGHHAAAGTPKGVLAHTMVVNGIEEFTINGKQISEMAYCALIANKYNVPVVYASGDNVACAQATETFGAITTTITKEAMGWKVAKCYPPSDVHKRVEQDVYTALTTNINNKCLYSINPPYKCYLRVNGKDEKGNPAKKEYNWESADLDSMMSYFWERI